MPARPVVFRDPRYHSEQSLNHDFDLPKANHQTRLIHQMKKAISLQSCPYSCDQRQRGLRVQRHSQISGVSLTTYGTRFLPKTLGPIRILWNDIENPIWP